MFKFNKEHIDLKNIFSGPRVSFLHVLIFVVLAIGNLIIGSIYYPGRAREGEIALRSVYAPYDFDYPWGANQKKTQGAEERMARSLPVVFDIDTAREEEEVKNIGYFFDNVGVLWEEGAPEEKKSGFRNFLKDANITLPDKDLLYAARLANKEGAKIKLEDIITSIYSLGIVEQESKEKLVREGRVLKIRNQKARTERLRPAGDILGVEDAKKVSREYTNRVFASDSKLRALGSEILSACLAPNMLFNRSETEKIREDAARNMPLVFDRIEVKKNELIVERGERITGQHIAILTELGAVGGIARKGPYAAGMSALILILLAACALCLYVNDKKLLYSPKNTAIILINCYVLALIAQFIIRSPQADYLVPLAGAAMLITILIGPLPAFLASIFMALILGVIAGSKVETVLVLFVSSFAGIYAVREARRRSRIIIAGLVSGAAGFIAVISISILNNSEFMVFINDALRAFGGGILSIFMVMGFLPLYEYVFKITTNISLLELSDLNHPALRELTLKAPGTYQHSIVVGNLAEVACEAIGANSLLARVGSYYHDIGKIEKAAYFSENEMGAHSKHEKLTPSMSALIIINHVKDGMELAKKHNLNPRIADFIAQHHGTSLIYFFYQRALEKIKDEQLLKEEDFRYPGPKPQTKEAAIVLLADSVEASSRALSDPTPSRIRGLVQKIINNKFIDNQLDECDLTLKDLNKIAASFVRVLTAIFHTRLDYPEKKAKNGKVKNY